MPASSLPPRAIQEYESGLVCDAVEQKSAHYGHETCTILVNEKGCEPTTKKPRIDRPIIQSSKG